jgi:hypothetical protein
MNLADIKRRVESMEEDCQAEIPSGAPLPMTAHVIVEARWLVEKLLDHRRHNSTHSSKKVEQELKDIGDRVKKLETRHRSSIEIGKFVQLSTAIIPDLRYLVDEIEACIA